MIQERRTSDVGIFRWLKAKKLGRFGPKDMGTFLLGTPPRVFQILVDSGSADLWVGAEGCFSDEGGNCVSKTGQNVSYPDNGLFQQGEP